MTTDSNADHERQLIQQFEAEFPNRRGFAKKLDALAAELASGKPIENLSAAFVLWRSYPIFLRSMPRKPKAIAAVDFVWSKVLRCHELASGVIAAVAESTDVNSSAILACGFYCRTRPQLIGCDLFKQPSDVRAILIDGRSAVERTMLRSGIDTTLLIGFNAAAEPKRRAEPAKSAIPDNGLHGGDEFWWNGKMAGLTPIAYRMLGHILERRSRHAFSCNVQELWFAGWPIEHSPNWGSAFSNQLKIIKKALATVGAPFSIIRQRGVNQVCFYDIVPR